MSSVMESNHASKLESDTMSKGHKEFYRTQKNIAAQVMASNKWTERCIYTDCVYIRLHAFTSFSGVCVFITFITFPFHDFLFQGR